MHELPPAFKRIWMQSECPRSAAACSGVAPSITEVSGLAPKKTRQTLD